MAVVGFAFLQDLWVIVSLTECFLNGCGIGGNGRLNAGNVLGRKIVSGMNDLSDQ